MIADITKNPEFWENLYKNGKTAWELNSPTPVFTELLNKMPISTGKRMLIPGCGHSFDVLTAIRAGYDVTAVDFSKNALSALRNLLEKEHLQAEVRSNNLLEDIPEFHGRFDVIYEYVFFCSLPQDALPLILRNFYNYLSRSGYLITILFPLEYSGAPPPFIMNVLEFYNVSKPYFDLVYFSKNIASVKPRKNREVLMILRKRDI